MELRRLLRPAVAGALIVAAASAGAAMQRGDLSALRQVERGRWMLKDAEGGTRQLCLHDRAALIQVMHGNAQCAQVPLESTGQSMTARYTCPGHGHGRTVITVETPRLLTIQTQGVRDGAPFDEALEARLVGGC